MTRPTPPRRRRFGARPAAATGRGTAPEDPGGEATRPRPGGASRRLSLRRFRHAKRDKADFDHIYDRDDPRPYARTLHDLEYQIPAHAQPIFADLVERRRAQLGREDLGVLDLCCSYGITAALLNHDLDLAGLYAHYCAPEVADLSTDALVAVDRDFLARRRRRDPAPVLGIDVAANAVAYARRVGLHRWSSTENLEEHDAGPELADALADVRLITVSGGLGYISERTFARVLRHAGGAEGGEGCWIAAFALRWTDLGPLERALGAHGLVTERLTGRTFRQRRFADAAERAYALSELRRRGIDPTGREEEGYFHASLILAAPPGGGAPALAELVAGASG